MNREKQRMVVSWMLGGILVMGLAPVVMAAGAPWETPMQTAVTYITGTTGTLSSTASSPTPALNGMRRPSSDQLPSGLM